MTLSLFNPTNVRKVFSAHSSELPTAIQGSVKAYDELYAKQATEIVEKFGQTNPQVVDQIILNMKESHAFCTSLLIYGWNAPGVGRA